MDLNGIVQNLALQTEFLFSGLCIGLALGLIISLLIAIWVYRDAESRGMSGVLWLLVVLVAGIIGLIIYLVVRGSHPVMNYPPGYPPRGYPPPGYPPPGYASAPPPAGWGAPAPPPTAPTPGAASVTCGSCGTVSPAGTKFCRQCGAPM